MGNDTRIEDIVSRENKTETGRQTSIKEEIGLDTHVHCNLLQQQKFMRQAIRLSQRNMERGGGPFGAVVVQNGQAIASGCNQVTHANDPTAHAEITAIRKAARKLGTFNLSGCEIYTSCEPCPMCLAAIYWARIDRIYYANTQSDAAEAGFDDAFLYQEFAREPFLRALPTRQLLYEEARPVFDAWRVKTDKIPY